MPFKVRCGNYQFAGRANRPIEEDPSMFALSLSLVLTTPQLTPRLDIHGDPLPPGAVARLGTVRYRRPVDGTLLGFTNDATAVVYATGRELVFVDVATGKATQRSVGKLLDAITPGARLRFPVMSGDGKRLVAWINPARLIVLDVAQSKVLRTFDMEEYAGVEFQLSHDGKSLVLLDHLQQGSYRLRWMDVATGEVRRETPWTKGAVARGCCQAPQSGFVAVGVQLKEDNTAFVVDVWEAATGKQASRAEMPPDRNHLVALAPDGKTSVHFNYDSAVMTLMDLAAGKQRGIFGKTPFVHAAAFSPDGKQIFVATHDALEQWDTATLKKQRSLPHPASPDYGTTMAISRNGQRLALEAGELVIIHAVAAGKTWTGPTGHNRGVGALAWSPSGKQLLTLDSNQAFWWDAATAKQQCAIDRRVIDPPQERESRPGSHRGLLAGVFADGHRLVASWSGFPLGVWETGGKAVKTPALGKSFFGAAVSPTRALVAFADGQTNVILVDLALGKRTTLTATKGSVAADNRAFCLVTFSPDGRYVAASGMTLHRGHVEITYMHIGPYDDPVIVWEVATGKQLANFPIRSLHGVQGLHFTQDGSRLVIATEHTVSICDLATGQEEQTFAGRHMVGASAVLSRDGTLLAAGMYDGTIRLWDTKSGKLLGDVPGHRRTVGCLAFSPDGTRLASASDDSTVLIWEVAELRRLAVAVPPPGELAALWEQLGDADPAAARKAMTAMLRHADAVTFLDEQLRTIEPVDARKIAALIDDLDHAKFGVRDQASKELEKLASIAQPALLARLKVNPPLEMQKRIMILLDRLEGPVTDLALLRSLRAVEVLERIGTPGARAVLERLAGGAPGHRLTVEAGEARDRIR
jgi:WD40 repeat protein